MIPLHFGDRQRRLFGVYTPASGNRRRQGAVICPPWGIEAMRAYRSMRSLADLLSKAGVDVFRFDYFGTGDSFGDDTPFDLHDWCHDAEQAIDEFLAMTGLRKIDVIGLRLGAMVASMAATRQPGQVDRLVLWDPVADGAGYLEELLTPERGNGGRDIEEASGFALPRRMQQCLGEARLELPGGQPAYIALSSPPVGRYLAELANGAAVVEIRPSPACWIEERDFGAGAVPLDLLRAIASWLT